MEQLFDKSVSVRVVDGRLAGCSVQGRTVDVRYLSDVTAAFGSSFQFERGRMHGRDVADPAYQAEIHGGPHGTEILALADVEERTVPAHAFFDRERHPPVFEAAGLGAESEIGGSAVGPFGNETVSGQGQAHGSVNEDFEIHVWKCPDETAHGFSPQFPGQIDALHPEILPECHGCGIDGVRLCGKMQFHGRTEPAREVNDAGIGGYESVDAQIRQAFQLLFHQRQMFVEGHGVETVIDTYAGAMSKRHGFRQFGTVESLTFGTEGQGAAAEIDGIGAIENGCFKLFASACGSEKFGKNVSHRHGGVEGWREVTEDRGSLPRPERQGEASGQKTYLSLIMAGAAGAARESHMKYIRTVLVCALCVFSGAAPAAAAGAFGIELGSDISRYGHGESPVSERWRISMYEITPPAPDARFDTYAVDTFNGKIIRIMASSPDDGSADASETLNVLDGLKDELISRYGEPSLNVEDVEDAGDDLRGYLADEGGLEVLEWDFSGGGTSPDKPGAVYVFLAGTETEKGQASYCTLYLESQEYPAVSDLADQMEQKEAARP